MSTPKTAMPSVIDQIPSSRRAVRQAPDGVVDLDAVVLSVVGAVQPELHVTYLMASALDRRALAHITGHRIRASLLHRQATISIERWHHHGKGSMSIL